VMGRSQRTINADGYSGWSQRGSAPQNSVQGTLNSKSFNGALLGVPLSTLDFSSKSYRFDAFMMMFDAHYEVIASLAGEAALEHDGESLTARLVDVEWHHDNGDVYPPGPDASGGRFWILAEDHPALPRVIRYKTDSYAVEALPEVCPGA
ncbi:MAG: hypothetical protein HKO64_02070, partial [Xanthomonadales bacterium]|nr:hypothetical protein [Xanthomonadales bacterium]